MDPIPLIIDTDMAPDDLVAIASLLRDPAVDVLAITVTGTGEAHCQPGMFVARAIVSMLVPEPITVACGPPDPLGFAQPFPDAWRTGVDGGSGLALVSPTFAPDPRLAQQVIVDVAAAEAAAGRRPTILTLGTLTNVAAAIELDPALPDHVTLVSMLGAIAVPGNVTPDVAGGSGPAVAEWNAHADPTAVRLVLEAGFDWTLVPLDATNSTPMSDELYRALESDHAAGPADLVFELWSKNPFMRTPDYYLWDPLAAAAIRQPALIETRSASLRVVEGAGLDGGQLVEDPAGSAVTIATAADRAAFEAFLLDRLRLGAARENAFTVVGTVSIRGGDGTCTVTLDPTSPPAGALQLRLENLGDAQLNAIVFELGDVTWSTIQAYVDPFDPSVPPPPVTPVGQLLLEGPGTTTGYGVSPAGSLGVACLVGPFDGPEVFLAGPFPIGD